MPFIEIRLPKPLNDVEKTALLHDVVSRTHEAVGSDPAIINVVLHELPPTNVSVGGHSAAPAD